MKSRLNVLFSLNKVFEFNLKLEISKDSARDADLFQDTTLFISNLSEVADDSLAENENTTAAPSPSIIEDILEDMFVLIFPLV